jgi:hypothetical protein
MNSIIQVPPGRHRLGKLIIILSSRAEEEMLEVARYAFKQNFQVRITSGVNSEPDPRET